MLTVVAIEDNYFNLGILLVQLSEYLIGPVSATIININDLVRTAQSLQRSRQPLMQILERFRFVKKGYHDGNFASFRSPGPVNLFGNLRLFLIFVFSAHLRQQICHGNFPLRSDYVCRLLALEARHHEAVVVTPETERIR